MNLNTQVFEQVCAAGAKILVVTKYWDKVKTNDLINKCDQSFGDVFFGVGENRTEVLEEKNLPREIVHYIGALQSKKLAMIAAHCSVVHSLDSRRYAKKLNNILVQSDFRIGAFIQINLDKDKPTGINPDKIEEFLEKMTKYPNIEILGISGMGQWSQMESEEAVKKKRQEFQLLKKIRDLYLPGKLISAGTSQDYEIALEEGVDIVRVGRSIIA